MILAFILHTYTEYVKWGINEDDYYMLCSLYSGVTFECHSGGAASTVWENHYERKDRLCLTGALGVLRNGAPEHSLWEVIQ